ncbi:hypothetical protein Tco_0972331 [Tanacetum coccineum]
MMQTPIRIRIREDPKEDPADYSVDGGDDNDESSRDDAVEQDKEEASEEEDDDEEEEHLALVDSSVDLVPSADDTKAFETDEYAPTPPSPRSHRARISKRVHFLAPTSGFEVGESSTAVAARQPRLDVATVDATLGHPIFREVAYGIEDVWDNMVRDIEERAPTSVEGLNQK